MQSSSHSCPNEIREAFCRSFSLKMLVVVTLLESVKGKDPFPVALIVCKFGSRSIGPLAVD